MNGRKKISGTLRFEDSSADSVDIAAQFEKIFDILHDRFKAPMNHSSAAPGSPNLSKEDHALPFPVVLTFQERPGEPLSIEVMRLFGDVFDEVLALAKKLPGSLGTGAALLDSLRSFIEKNLKDGASSLANNAVRLKSGLRALSERTNSDIRTLATNQRGALLLENELGLKKDELWRLMEMLGFTDPTAEVDGQSGNKKTMPPTGQEPGGGAASADKPVTPPEDPALPNPVESVIPFETTQLLGWLTKETVTSTDTHSSATDNYIRYGFILGGVVRFPDDGTDYGAWARFDVIGPDGAQLLTHYIEHNEFEGWLAAEEKTGVEVVIEPTQELRAAFLRESRPKAVEARETVKGRLWFSDGQPFGVRTLAIFSPPGFSHLADECCPPKEFQIHTDDGCCDDEDDIPPVLLAPQALAVARTDESGYFEFDYPKHTTISTQHALLRVSGLLLPLGLKLQGEAQAGPYRFPEPILLEVDSQLRNGNLDEITSKLTTDCGCNDLGFGDRDRAVDEFNFDIVVRTTDPMVTRSYLEIAPGSADSIAPSNPIDGLFRVPLTRRDPIVWDKTPLITQAATISHGRVLTVKQVWRADGYSLGDLRYSLPLAPLQKKNIAVLDWGRDDNLSLDSSQENIDSLSNMASRERGISEIVNTAMNETLRGRSDSGGGGGSSGFGFSIGGLSLGSSGGSSSAWSSSSQDSTKSLAASFVNQLRDKTIQSANAYRSQRVTTVQQVSQLENVRAVTETVANRNACHAITVQYFEVLRHFRVDYELAAVRECLYIPMPIEPFDAPKALRWRSTLERFLPSRRLLDALDACQRLAMPTYPGPSKSYADENLLGTDGEMALTLVFAYPKGDINALDWRGFFELPINAPDELEQLFIALKAKTEAERLSYYTGQIVPVLAGKMISFLSFSIEHKTPAQPVPVNAQINFKRLIVSGYRADMPLRIVLTEDADIRAFKRNEVDAVWVGLSVALPSYVRIELADLLIYVTTKFRRSLLVNRTNIGSPAWVNSSGLGTPIRMPTPVLNEDLKVPETEDLMARTDLLQHLNEHLEYYHKAIWSLMDSERRFSLLDGYIAPNAGGRSVASVVDNRLVAIVGNSLVMPLSPGLRLDYFNDVAGKLDMEIDPNSSSDELLLQLYKPSIPNPSMRIAVPTRGVFAESVMGSCNSCEAIDDARNWRYWEHPLPDEPTQIDPLSTTSRAQAPTNMTPNMAPPVVVQERTNVGDAPSPFDLAKAIVAIASGSPFPDARGLQGTQQNAREALSQSYATTTKFGEMATSLNMKQQEIAGDIVKAVVSYYTGVPIPPGSSGSSSSGNKVKESINRDAASGNISSDDAKSAIGKVNDAMIASLTGDKPMSPLDKPEITSAIGAAAERGAPFSVSKGDTKVDVGERSSQVPSAGQSRWPWPFRLLQPSVAEARPQSPGPRTAEPDVFERMWQSLGIARTDADVYSDQKFLKQQRAGKPHMNMCATRLSLALHDAGAGMLFDGWSKYIVHDRNGRKLIASAENLMELLEDRLGKPLELSKSEARNYLQSPRIAHTRGIIAFKNYWRRGPNDALTGDHITLWNGDATAQDGSNVAQICFWPISLLTSFVDRNRRT
ncbi:T6SS effector amidase Tae4 family protein [Pseudomonas mandelii]|uniref:T6SS effector amidase Tae4 family protein n=1 Tax=Pseudomonas mandelii TaxID=75612 RepID=UPI00224A7E7E|nr:T6SS effector amidase Tae4 family protein [Pseudomonas mandelii]MCX2900401.1 T6SS effector amidase Tae4 family protein [Pseudomonas mandelii]